MLLESQRSRYQKEKKKHYKNLVAPVLETLETDGDKIEGS